MTSAPHTHPAERETPAGEAMRELRIVFDGLPGPQSGRFIEVETPDGKSLSVGEWHGPRADGFYELRIPRIALLASTEASGDLDVQKAMARIIDPAAWSQFSHQIVDCGERRRKSLIQADTILSGPIASELARLKAERDEARTRAELWGDWIADAYELLNDACMTTDADDSVEPGIVAATRRVCAALTTLRADHAEVVANAREPVDDAWDEVRRLEGECRIFLRERDEWKAVANSERADHAAEVARKDEEIARLRGALADMLNANPGDMTDLARSNARKLVKTEATDA